MKKNNEPIVRRGEIYYADLSLALGSEQGGSRPVLIVQNDIGNKNAPTTIVAPITSKLTKRPLPTHVPVSKNIEGLVCESVILLEQVRTIDKQRLKEKLGAVPSEVMEKVNKALRISLGL
jgi:mRNA interferase MazF